LGEIDETLPLPQKIGNSGRLRNLESLGRGGNSKKTRDFSEKLSIIGRF